MNLFQNLCPHESILMILGIVMFSALIFALVWSVVKEKKFGILLPFFLLPVIMVGYPSLGAIKYENNKVELEDEKQKLFDGNFNSPEQYEAFTKAYLAIAQSCKANHDPEAQESLAEAQLATGNFEEAREIAEKTLQLQPQNTTAQEIRRVSSEQIQQENKFKNSIDQMSRMMALIEMGNMDRREGVDRMTKILSDLQPPRNIESRDALILAKALAHTGKKESALKMVDQVLQKPGIERGEIVQATELKTEIESDRYAPPREEMLNEQELNASPALSPEILNQQRIKTRLSTNFQLRVDQ